MEREPLNQEELEADLPEIERIKLENEKLLLENDHLRRRIAELEEVATKDPLTGAYNRRGFEEEFKKIAARNMPNETERRDMPAKPVTLLILDIDNFKNINDLLGHALGDEAIKQVVAKLQEFIRESDIVARFDAENLGIVSRHGGDEIVAILPDVDESTMFDRLKDAETGEARLPLEIEVEGKPVTVSVGIATILPNESPAQAIERADEALYAAKTAGKNRVMRFGDLPEKD